MEYVIEMLNITKEFPGIKANDNITLRLEKGTIHALLGENGAGKSTLMSVLFGLYQPEEGEIKVNGNTVKIDNPNIATELGIGMVHQHFKLVDVFTALENIVLGDEPKGKFGQIDYDSARKKINEISEKYNLYVDLDEVVGKVSVGTQQRIEILKMLYRDADILIFDEPTAVLTPQEIDGLMEVMRNLAAEGKSIIIITHKLREIKAVASACTVIRKGKGIGTVVVADVSEQDMADLMVGRSVNFHIDKKEAEPKQTVLKVDNLNAFNNKKIQTLKNVSFEVKAGEILGVAGIEGNGQTELINAITGLDTNFTGKVFINGTDITKKSIREKTLSGIGHIPEDRHKHGLVLDYTVGENMVLQQYYQEPFSKNGILNKDEIEKFADTIIERFDVRSGQGAKSVARGLSGGNQQKAIIGREIMRSPDLLIAAQPTRGLDVGAIEFVHRELIQQRDLGKAVMLVSLELDEILGVSDRVIILYQGEVVGELVTKHTDEREIGLYMAGAKRSEK